MIAGRILYRTRQFWRALGANPAPEDLKRVRSVLNPGLMALFLRLSPAEQAHSISVFNKLVENGESHLELLQAALLHDVGKSRFPLRLWERVAIVLGKAAFPQRSHSWGSLPPEGWPPAAGWKILHGLRRPFVVARQHPNWGADMVTQAGGSSLTVTLIRRHQDTSRPESTLQEDQFLSKIQAIDDES